MNQGDFRRALKRLGMNYTQAAARLGTTLETVSRYANGHRPISRKIAAHVQTLLDLHREEAPR